MITDKFIHIHLPRTGGQLLRGIIHENRKKLKIYYKDSHMSMEESLKKLAQKNEKLKIPALCVVRNPWDWYVSRYFFRQKEIKRNKIGPQTKVEKCGNDIAGFRKHMKMLNAHIEAEKPVEPVKNRNTPRIWKEITISNYFEYLCTPEPKYIIKLEEFPEAIIEVLTAIAPFDKKQLDRKFVSKYNSSKHDHYREYYDDELKDMVTEWDGEFIKRFCYKFGE